MAAPRLRRARRPGLLPGQEEKATVRKLETILKKAMRFTAALGAFALLVVAGMSVMDILVREATGRPVHGVHDISKLLTIVIVAACFPAGLMERRQIKVTLLAGFIGPRTNRVLRIVSELATGFMFVCIAWFLSQHAAKVSARSELSMVLNWPVGPWWWAACALFWACIPAQIFVILAEIFDHSINAEEV